MNSSIKVLMVGSDSQWAIEHEYLKGLKEHCEVDFYNAHGTFLTHYHSSIYNKVKYRLGFSSILQEINNRLVEITDNKDYHIVFVFKGMEIYPDTLIKLKQKGIKLINYNPDHPFKFESKGSGNKHVINSIKLYDHHFTYSKEIEKELMKTYQVSTTWLPFGYSISKQPEQYDNEICKICFIGNPDSNRARYINELLTNNIPVDVFGNNWHKYLNKNDKLGINKAVYQEQFVNTAQKYRANLNVFREQNANSHNMRTFEIPAIGGLLLSPVSDEQKLFFTEDKEIIFYDNFNFVEKAKYLLSISEEEAFKIKLSAYRKSIQNDYSYKSRSRVVYKLIKSMILN